MTHMATTAFFTLKNEGNKITVSDFSNTVIMVI